jgi:hypothetical protein
VKLVGQVFVSCLEANLVIESLVILLASASLFQTESQLDTITDHLASTASRIEVAFVASVETERRSLQGTKVSGGNLDWGFSIDSGGIGDVLMYIEPKELREWLQSGKLKDCPKWSERKKLEGLAGIIHNSAYGANVAATDGDANWEIALFQSDPRQMVGTHPLLGMHKMLPYAWSLQKLRAKAKLTSASVSDENPNWTTYKFELDVPANVSPFDEPFKGTWVMTYDKLKRCIIRQEMVSDSGDDRVSNEFKFSDAGDLPDSLVSTNQFSWEGRQHSIENEYEFLMISLKHAMPASACTLPFFGLPEPDTNTPREVASSGRWWFLALGALVAGAIVLRISRRTSK